jgi:hypothetical protein
LVKHDASGPPLLESAAASRGAVELLLLHAAPATSASAMVNRII